MNISEAEAHSRAVVSIQALLSKYRPDTFSHHVAELALDLAFNGHTPTGANFVCELLDSAGALISKQIAAHLRTAPAVGQNKFTSFPIRPSVRRRLAVPVVISHTIDLQAGAVLRFSESHVRGRNAAQR